MGTPAVVSGAQEVAAFFNGRARAVRKAVIDGVPGAAWVHRKETKVVFAFTLVDGRITEVELLADPLVVTDTRVTIV
jgi:RNA polymerase sigma-70 factor (ECF subfamily)